MSRVVAVSSDMSVIAVVQKGANGVEAFRQ